MRRFKTEPIPAGELLTVMHNLQMRVDLVRFEHPKRRRCGQQAARLLLRWWGTGHNPARNVATCRECGGSGRGSVSGDRCPACKRMRPLLVSHCSSCNGTGKAVKL